MICLDAYKNLNILNQQGQLAIGPCCISPATPVKEIDFYNNNFLKSIRASWDNHTFPPACKNCKQAEERGNSSRRLDIQQWYDDHGHNNKDVSLVKIDYWTGNTCNLRCVICGPTNSSGWESELGIPNYKQIVNSNWKSLDLGQIEHIHFNGGEPLLSKEHISLLEAVPNKSKVELNYNTNATIRPSQYLQDLWAQFKNVKLDFSIDDIGHRFEYQRYPAKWDEVTANLKWFVDTMPVNCLFGVNTTVSVLNQPYLDELDAWLAVNFAKNRLGDSITYNKQAAQGLFSTDNLQINADKILSFVNDCDTRRGTNWRSVFPDLFKSI